MRSREKKLDPRFRYAICAGIMAGAIMLAGASRSITEKTDDVEFSIEMQRKMCIESLNSLADALPEGKRDAWNKMALSDTEKLLRISALSMRPLAGE